MPRGHTWLTRGSAWHATWQSDPLTQPLTRLLTGDQLPLTSDPAVVNGVPPPLTGGGSVTARVTRGHLIISYEVPFIDAGPSLSPGGTRYGISEAMIGH
ncbi:hypothetical protein Tco_1001581 [Tanacetum coccineum]